MGSYTHGFVVAVPEADIADANQLALVLGENPADEFTFSVCGYEDAQGNQYAVAAGRCQLTFLEAAGRPLVAPDFAPDADLVAASRAQAKLEVGQETIPVSPDKIGIVFYTQGRPKAIIDASGLTPIGI